MQNIIPSSDLRNKYQEVSKFCKETNQPVFITVNGRGDLVLINLAEYEELQDLKILKNLVEAHEDVKQGKVRPIDEFIKELRTKYLT